MNVNTTLRAIWTVGNNPNHNHERTDQSHARIWLHILKSLTIMDGAPTRKTEPGISSPSGTLEDAGTGDTPVATLLGDYRTRQSAWLLETDKLARLRDEVSEAADRERTEIVAEARRRINAVIANARRELLVLGEQVRALLGENLEPAPDVLEAAGRKTEPPVSQPTVNAVPTTVSTIDAVSTTVSRRGPAPQVAQDFDY